MLSINEEDIDRITEVFYLILKGRKPSPVRLPEDYPDNEIRQLTTYVNHFLEEYDSATDLIYALSKGNLDVDIPRSKILFLHSLKSLQANLRHLTWKTQQIAKGDFAHEVDFMGDFSTAFNSMIRQLKESFEALSKSASAARGLLDATQETLFLLDQNAIILAANKGGAETLRMTPEEMTGKNIFELLPGKIRKLSQDHFHLVMKKNEAVKTEERLNRHDFSSVYYPVRNETGAAIGVAIFAQDITERKRAEDALQKRVMELADARQAMLKMMEDIQDAQKEAEAATQAKSEFLANMSHEIRTPMNSVLGFLELALEDPDLPEFQRNNLTTAHNSAKSLLTLINDILDVSKLESGRLELEKLSFTLKEMMEDTLQVFEMKCREKGLNLSFHIHPGLPLRLKGDPIRLGQVIINLLGNALKFTENGEICVTVDPLTETDMIHFAVSDTGIGIPRERLSGIFEPFTQADSSTSRRFGGTGLGTTISKQLVELMDGEIWAESEVGEGSIFHFTVRMEAAENEDAEMGNDLLAPDRNPSQASRNCYKILIAEDLEENMMLARIRLGQAGHTLIEAGNGLEAVSAYKNETPDIILMDIHMPKMDGLTAAKQIRQLETDSGNRVPIIALTASVMKNERKKCLDAGMDAVVAKPVNFEALYQIMDQLVPEDRKKQVMSDEVPEAIAHPPSFISHHNEIIDIKKGLQIWQDMEVYQKALLNFSRKYGNAGDQMTDLLQNGDREGAYSIAHALKGVAGNLCITEVFRISEKLNAEIREKEKDELLPQIENLTEALQKAVSSIQQAESQQDAHSHSKSNLPTKNNSSLEKLLREMLTAFGEYNPAVIEPFLEELGRSIDWHQLAPIKQGLDQFDFDAAKAETVKLAVSLDINVE